MGNVYCWFLSVHFLPEWLSRWFVAKKYYYSKHIVCNCKPLFFLFSFQTKSRMLRSSLLWVSMHWFCTFAGPNVWKTLFTNIRSLYFRWARLWKGHPVWEDGSKVWLHPLVIWGSAPRWGGFWLREGQAAPGHHAEGRARTPGRRAGTRHLV